MEGFSDWIQSLGLIEIFSTAYVTFALIGVCIEYVL